MNLSRETIPSFFSLSVRLRIEREEGRDLLASGVRCHRARLETRTKELHSAASGRGGITREGNLLTPDA